LTVNQEISMMNNLIQNYEIILKELTKIHLKRLS